MTTSTLTLTDFLLARVAEDETAAQCAGHGCGWMHEHNAGWIEVDLPAEHNVRPRYEMTFIRRFDPDRVLAECEAKRRIVEWAAMEPVDEQIFCFLALPYADHPDYDESWRP